MLLRRHGRSRLLAGAAPEDWLKKSHAAAASAPAGSPKQQIGDYYRAAMDLKRLDALGIEPLQADLAQLATLDSPRALGVFAARLEAAYGGASPLVALSATDAKDVGRTLLVFHPGLLILDQDDYAKPESERVRSLYTAYITAMFRQLGDPAERAAEGARTVHPIDMRCSARHAEARGTEMNVGSRSTYPRWHQPS